jgi:hypothetical protein
VLLSRWWGSSRILRLLPVAWSTVSVLLLSLLVLLHGLLFVTSNRVGVASSWLLCLLLLEATWGGCVSSASGWLSALLASMILNSSCCLASWLNSSVFWSFSSLSSVGPCVVETVVWVGGATSTVIGAVEAHGDVASGIWDRVVCSGGVTSAVIGAAEACGGVALEVEAVT